MEKKAEFQLTTEKCVCVRVCVTTECTHFTRVLLVTVANSSCDSRDITQTG